MREVYERRRPNYLKDCTAIVTLPTSRILDNMGIPIRARNVRISNNHREARRSSFADFWRKAELEEMAALRQKGAIIEIPRNEVPQDEKPISTRWVYAVKSDHQGCVIRFMVRLAALGKYRRPGADFVETFSPVARMSSFHLMMALAAALSL